MCEGDDNNTDEQRLNQFISLDLSSRVCPLKKITEKEVFLWFNKSLLSQRKSFIQVYIDAQIFSSL